jgi:Mrp family chromosome partitioning ATPase
MINDGNPAPGGELNTTWHLYADRIHRAKWLILVLGLLAGGVAYGLSVSHPTTYTVWATLSTATANRAPEQDGVLASGYVDYFNSTGYQNKLKAAEIIPGDVTLRARTAAASPIIYVEATSESRSTAVDAAPTAAKVFSDEINSHLRAAQEETIAAVRKPFDDARLANGVVSAVSLDQLQDQINQITANSTNRLMSLQLESGVTKTSPKAWPSVLLSLVGGLVIGCFLAVMLGGVSRRLPNGAELATKTGVGPFVEMPEPRSAKTRRHYAYRVQQLVNAVAVAELPARSVVVVTSTVDSAASAQIARELAEGRAAQGISTLLVNADLRTQAGVGFGDLISEYSVDLDIALVATGIPHLVEIGSGHTVGEPFESVTAPRAASLLTRFKRQAEFIVILAPPITEAAESQILCAVADGVLLVIDSHASKVPDTTAALSILKSFKAKLMGSVLTNVARSSWQVRKPAKAARGTIDFGSGGRNTVAASGRHAQTPARGTDLARLAGLRT